MKLNGYIYKITNRINGKVYIGKTFNFIERWRQHVTGRGCTKILSSAIKKYGITSFTFEVLVEIHSYDLDKLEITLSSLEMFFIKKYDSFHFGYNSTKGGDGQRGRTVTKEIRDKIRTKLLGHKHSEETKLKMSISSMGHPYTEESKQKMRSTWYNRPLEERDSIKRMRLENLKKNNEQRVINAGIGHRKKVLQFSKKGELIREWDSAKEAGIFLTVKPCSSISGCCKGRLKTAFGFIWKYKEV